MYQKYKRFKQRQAGARYEKHVADTLRLEGWEVIENGLNGINDHGIDLIASKDGIRRYVQCKGLKRDRIIHEDVVSQLYGSVAGMEGPENLVGVEMFIYSPAQLGSYAAAEADRLHIQFVQLNYPSMPQRHSHYFYKRKHRSYHSANNY